MEVTLGRMKQLIMLLNDANRAYYKEAREIISNYEYDKLYDELVELEKSSGITLANSPTASVGYRAISELQKESHSQPMLSLNKTKNVVELTGFIGSKRVLVSWKLDGLTVVLTYRDGQLYKAVTRGNGEIGEVITNNARTFKNIPLRIGYKGELIVRGEAIIKYSDFERINAEIPDIDAKYKNPRNLCSGSVRQLNNEVTANRGVHFFAFALVKANGVDFQNSRESQMKWLEQQGFDVVEYKAISASDTEETVLWFESRVSANDVPSDGLVIIYDDIKYGNSLGSTARFPRDSIAFKWKDELQTTTLKEIEWSTSRTGLINPIAVFEPVELEGTTVGRASVHNISILKSLELGVGDQIQVYKANMIIPQIADNTTRSGTIEIPNTCPVCGGATALNTDNAIQTLYCTNKNCQAKKLKSFEHFVSRDALNIEGLSESTLQKFISMGFIKDYADIFSLECHKNEILDMEGFGVKSYEKLIKNIEKSRTTTPARLIYSLGITNIGMANAELLCHAFHNDIHGLLRAKVEDIYSIKGMGEIMAAGIIEYLADKDNILRLQNLLTIVELIADNTPATEKDLDGLVFVLTGSMSIFESRDALKKNITSRGGKVTSAVTSKTNFLINNDVTNPKSMKKTNAAREFGVPIITENQYVSGGAKL